MVSDKFHSLLYEIEHPEILESQETFEEMLREMVLQILEEVEYYEDE
jgi:hypothetical protein